MVAQPCHRCHSILQQGRTNVCILWFANGDGSFGRRVRCSNVIHILFSKGSKWCRQAQERLQLASQDAAAFFVAVFQLGDFVQEDLELIGLDRQFVCVRLRKRSKVIYGNVRLP